MEGQGVQGVRWQHFQRVPLTPACCKLQHKHILENVLVFRIHLLWQHRGIGSAVRKMLCFLTPCVNTPVCHCPGAATGAVLASKGAADVPELVCVSSQCSRLEIAGGCVALPLQLCSHSPQQTLSLFHLSDSPDLLWEQQISFVFPVPPSQGRGKGSCLTQHL